MRRTDGQMADQENSSAVGRDAWQRVVTIWKYYNVARWRKAGRRV